jgi:hypothetical protein
MTTVGLEPTIFGSEDRRLIHWATRPLVRSALSTGTSQLLARICDTECKRRHMHAIVGFECFGETRKLKYSDTGTRTRVSWVRAKYPNQLDYIGGLYNDRGENPLDRRRDSFDCSENTGAYHLGAGYIFSRETRNPQYSDTGTRTRVSWVRAKYPNQLDYIGVRGPGVAKVAQAVDFRVVTPTTCLLCNI